MLKVAERYAKDGRPEIFVYDVLRLPDMRVFALIGNQTATQLLHSAQEVQGNFTEGMQQFVHDNKLKVKLQENIKKIVVSFAHNIVFSGPYLHHDHVMVFILQYCIPVESTELTALQYLVLSVVKEVSCHYCR